MTVQWRHAVRRMCGDEIFKPFAQGLFFDLAANPDHPPQRIHAGLRIGHRSLVDYLSRLQDAGVHHAAFNLKASRRPADEVLQELAEYVLPHFPSHPGLSETQG